MTKEKKIPQFPEDKNKTENEIVRDWLLAMIEYALTFEKNKKLIEKIKKK